MSQSNTAGNEDRDIWDAFDEAVDNAEAQLEQAWANHELVQQTEEPLSEEYISSLTQLEETIQEFDSVYEVTEAELERANGVDASTDFLAAVTLTYREYHEGIIDRRAEIAKEWFDTLASCIEASDSDVAADQSTLRRKIRALEKLTNAGKYSQLLTSDRIELADIEDKIRELDRAVRDAVPTDVYTSATVSLTESFHDQYTTDLSALVQEGADRESISITDHVADLPELDPIVEKVETNDQTADDAEALGTIVGAYAEVALLTGRRVQTYKLGEKLLSIVETSDLQDTVDDTDELHRGLKAFQIEPIERIVGRIVEGEATTSDTERLLQVLSKHDGSVRQTVESLDRPTDELFADLHELFVTDEVSDLEVQF